jgi:alpha-tubulin suppressor-like RCC1 family protein
VITQSGKVVVWGTDDDRDEAYKDMPSLLESDTAIGISSGGGHFAALTLEGKAFCWGNNDDLQSEVPTDLMAKVETVILM